MEEISSGEQSQPLQQEIKTDNKKVNSLAQKPSTELLSTLTEIQKAESVKYEDVKKHEGKPTKNKKFVQQTKQEFQLERKNEDTNFTNIVDSEQEQPKTFQEMLNSSEGNLFQRIERWWIKPKLSPEKTVRIMETLQIHRLQKLVINFFGRRQASYNLPESKNFTSLVDFATNKTLLNEKFHLSTMAGGIVMLAPLLINGSVSSGIISVAVVFEALNFLLILTQRYTRARLILAINRGLALGKFVDSNIYDNELGIKLPTQPITRSKNKLSSKSF